MKHIILSIIILSFFACSSEKKIYKKRLPEQELKLALEKLKNDDLFEAKNDLYAITIRYIGTKVAADAQYYLAKTYYRMEKYLMAADAYQRVYDRHNESNSKEKSQYGEALSYEKLSPSYALDQKYTKVAIQKYKDFIADYPKSLFREKVERSIFDLTNKIAHKFYYNAVLYFKMEKWRSALKYSKLVEKFFSRSPYVEKAQMLRVKAYIAMEKWIQAEQELEIYSTKFPEKVKNNDEVTALKNEITEGKQDVLNG